MVLRAYVDGSGAPDHAENLVLAGYVSRLEEWDSFCDEWQQVLNMPVRLKYFKMNEAVRLKGEFRDFSEARRDERLRLLYEIIERRVLFSIACIVPFADFENATKVAVPIKSNFHPYHLAFMAIMGQLRQRQKEIGLDERVDFFFDEEPLEKTILLENWEYATSDTPEDEAHLVTQKPVFADDENTLPLQAADLWAWLVRNWWDSDNLQLSRYRPPWKQTRDMAGMIISYDESNIRRVLEEAVARAGSAPIR